MHTDALHIAVLGDLHGHFTLAYRLLKRWETETGTPLDLVVQVGDLGAFPPPFRLDDATRRFADHDPDELDFARYHAGEDPEVCEILAPDAGGGEHGLSSPSRRFDADLVFIRGNHEDFEYLASMAGPNDPPVPLDYHGRIQYLANGAVWTFARRGRAITFGALGGISHHDGLQAVRTDPSMFYTASEVRKLQHARRGGPDPHELDVLLTHEPPFAAAARASARYAESGSREVAAIIASRKPRYHFCGHYHEPGMRLDVPTRETESWLLHAVNFHKPHRLNPGCIGILRWNTRDDSSFELLAAPWLAEYTRHTFRAM